ncbi:MAG TPA: tagaturonate reductase [Phnomibacter sp.]|nr:tagaturonate reductase [Phnomibacter sp.]
MKCLSKLQVEKNESVRAAVPDANCFQLPERVLQFGTGILLRGVPDYFIDKANKQGVFNGRIAVVTSIPGANELNKQDGMFCHLIRGVMQSKVVDEVVVNTSISRVLVANDQWNDILEIAASPDLDIIISNTTEVGITLFDEQISENPPHSFPGKLLSILYKRYQTFGGDVSKGLVIIPTELVANNGRLLQTICLQLAEMNNLEPAFIHWLKQHNHFCDSMVDRIVQGQLSDTHQQLLNEKIGVTDRFAIFSEPYALWAIEVNNEAVKKRLDFAAVNSEIVLSPDIYKFGQLKLHLLNGTHTFCCGVALLCGFETVKEALADKDFYAFIHQLVYDEIVPEILSDEISAEDAAAFTAIVLDRISNPFIDYYWYRTALNFSSKMRLRNLPVMLSYTDRNGSAPQHMAMAFAAMLLYLRSSSEKNGKYYGDLAGKIYPIPDDKVPLLNTCWVNGNTKESVRRLLGESAVWGVDLNKLTGFTAAVTYWMHQFETQNPREVLAAFIHDKKPMAL